MATTIFFVLIVGFLIFAAARLYGSKPSAPPPQDTFLEDRLLKIMSADLIDEIKTYANRTEQTVREVIDEALREFLQRKRDERGTSR
ncbi:MAG: hypothetical protein EXS64_09375 [Candidatus Latescibacteria bacterium]|nr:hypothetical protein [Candidatus Latescibacterota bacterium]